MEIINAKDLAINKERCNRIEQLKDIVMKNICEANNAGKKETYYDNYCTAPDVLDYPEVKQMFEEAGYTFRTVTNSVFGGRTVTHTYICW